MLHREDRRELVDDAAHFFAVQGLMLALPVGVVLGIGGRPWDVPALLVAALVAATAGVTSVLFAMAGRWPFLPAVGSGLGLLALGSVLLRVGG